MEQISWILHFSKLDVGGAINQHWQTQVGRRWVMGQGLVQNYQHQTNAKWSISKYRRMVKSHSLWMSFGHEASFQSDEFHKLSSLLTEGSTKTEGSCIYWGGSHYRLFDGTVLSLPKGCSHTLLTEPRDNTLKISTKTATDCTPGDCNLKLSLNVETEDYEIEVDQGIFSKSPNSSDSFSFRDQQTNCHK